MLLQRQQGSTGQRYCQSKIVPFLCRHIREGREAWYMWECRLNNLRVINMDSGTESLPLRHAVWNAEKPGSNPRKIARNGRNFANLAHTPDWRKCPAFPLRQALRPVSLKDPLAVRFQRLQQAKAVRSQTDDSAKAGLTFSFSTQEKGQHLECWPSG